MRIASLIIVLFLTSSGMAGHGGGGGGKRSIENFRDGVLYYAKNAEKFTGRSVSIKVSHVTLGQPKGDQVEVILHSTIYFERKSQKTGTAKLTTTPEKAKKLAEDYGTEPQGKSRTKTKVFLARMTGATGKDSITVELRK